MEFLYKDVCGPTNRQGNHLPDAVGFDFTGLKLGNAPPWDSNNPTVSDTDFNELKCSDANQALIPSPLSISTYRLQ